MGRVNIIPKDSDFYIEVLDLKDSTDGSPITTASVIVSFFDKIANTAVTGAENVVAEYDTPNNVYRALIPATAAFVLDTSYICKVIVTQGGLETVMWLDGICEHYKGA